MICASIISLTGWLMLGTVSLTMLYYLKLLTLKSRLDKFWQHQDMIYDIQAEFTEPEVVVYIAIKN